MSIEPLETRTLLAVDLVTSNADDGSAGTLRSVIANAGVGDSIQFQTGISLIDLTQGQIEIGKNLTIGGPGASSLTIDQTTAGGARLFQIDSPAVVSMSGLTLTGGTASNANGGGIDNAGTLTLSSSTVSNNSATGGGLGGGIDNAGMATLTNDTVANNSAPGEGGGGVFNALGATMTVNNSTVSHNSALLAGGIGNQGTLNITASTMSNNTATALGSGGIGNDGTLTVSDSTVANNSAAGFGGGILSDGTLTISDSTVVGNSSQMSGGGIETFTGVGSGTANLANDIVAGNSATTSDPDVSNSLGGGSFAVTDHNLIGELGDATGFGGNGNIIAGTDDLSSLGLGSLAANGGPTQTIALLAGSPAIDAGDDTPPVATFGSTPATDQRGLARIVNGTIDIGAFETQQTPQSIDFTALTGGTYTIKLAGTSPNQQIDLFDPNGKVISQSPAAITVSISFTNASGQAVQLVVDSSDGAIPAPITFDGGTGAGSSLVLQGGTATSDVYSPGPQPGQGTDMLTIGGNTESVQFSNLAPVFDSVAGPATVTGTSGNDAINYTEGNNPSNVPSTAWGQVSVNNLEAFNFTNKSILTIDTGAGTDTVSVNNSNTPTGLTGITVSGGEPAAGDTVNFSAATGPVTVFEADNTASSKPLVSGYSVPVTLSGIVTANLDAGGQTVTATGTSQNDNTVFTPTGASAGTFYDDIGSGNNAVPTTVFNVANVSGNLMVFNDPGGNADQVTLRATDARDLIEINQGSGVAQVLANNVTALLPVELGISAEILNVQGLGGENTFQVIPAPGIGGQAQDNLLINLDGGDTSASNTLIVGSSFGSAPGTLAANQFVVVNKSPVVNSGVVRVFTSAVANPDINYQNIQTVSANVSGTSSNPNLLVMGPDLNEPNDSLGTATFLGSASTIQIQNATIFPGNGEQPGTPADNDYYRVVAQMDGMLDFQVFYRTFSSSLLPGGGSLSLQVLDAAGNVLGSGSNEITVPAAAGQSYYLHVSGATPAAVNGYDATIINTNALNLSAAHENVTIRVDPNDSTIVQVLDGATVLQQYSNNANNHINIVGDANNNTVTVDSSNGLVNAAISFDGGGGKNELILSQTGGSAQTTDVYSVGPNPGQGTDVITGPSGTQTVSFVNLAPVLDNVPAATATVNGTNGDNAITYAQGPGGGIFVGNTGLVTVDNQESYEFNNKTNLVINTLAGTDSVNLNNPNRPAGLTGITVNGGNSSAGDTLTVNGTGTSNSINFKPTSVTAATIIGAGPVTISATGIGQTAINGQGGNDALSIVSPGTPSPSQIGFTPGATLDSGSVTMQALFSGGSYMPMSFSNLGTSGSVAFTNAVGTGADGLNIFGTNADNLFRLSPALVQVVNPASLIPLTLSIGTKGITQLNLIGQGGNDTFNVPGNVPFTTGVELQGTAGGNNTVNFTGDGTAPVTVDLAAGTVDEAGFQPFTLSGIGTLNVNAGGASLTVVGTGQNDSFSYTPQPAGQGLIQLASSATSVNVSNVGGAGLTLDPLGGNNTVTVNGTSNSDTIATILGSTTTVRVDGLLPINLVSADTQSLVLAGGAGNDTYSFSGASGPASVTVTGGSGMNALVLPGAAGNDSYTIGAGTDSSSGTAAYTLPSGASPPIAFSGVQNIGVAGDGGAGSDSLTVNGTGGNDTFNLKGTATSAGTVQVNGGPLVSFLSLGTGAGTTIDLNGAGGADTFNVTQPASWRVANVVIGGGTPGAGGDLLLNAEGTAGTDAFTYTSTGPQSGTIGLTSGGTTTYTLTNIANLGLNELGPAAASLSVTNANAIITPASTPNSGTVTTTDTANSTALLPLTYTNIATVTASGTSAVINAPDDGDSVTISAAGLVTVTNKLGVSNTVDASGYTNLAIDLLGANDTLTFLGDSALFGGGVTIVGGESGYTVTAPTGAASTLTMGAISTVSGIVGGNVTLQGIANLVLNGTATALNIVDNTANTNLSITPTGAGAGTIQASGSGTLVDFTGAAAAGVTASLPAGGSTLSIDGATTGETLMATNTSVTVTGDVAINYTAGQLAAIDINGNGGGNTLIVNSAAGAVITPIVYSGGNGAGNSLQLTGGTAISDVYTPGPNGGQGNDTLNFGTVANPIIESVQFSLLTPVTDSVAGPLTVDGTTGNDAITAGATANVVTVNNLESITFANKTGLTLNGNGGNDTFNISPSNLTLTPAGTVTVNGAAGADDALTVNGNTGIGYNPTGPGAGNVTTAGNPTVAFTSIASTAIVGDATGDTLTITPAMPGEVSFTAGATFDSGSLTFDRPFDVSLTPLQFSNLGSGKLSIADAGGGVDVNGPNSASNLNVSAAGIVQIFKPLGGGVEVTLPITVTAAALRLIGHSGNDTFNVPGNHPFSSGGLEVQGAAGNNTLNFNGNGTAPVTVDLDAGTVTETGSGSVTYLGIGTVNVNAGGQALAVTGTTGDDTIAATPTGANSVSFQAYSGGTAQNGQGGTLASLTPIAPAFNATNVSAAAGSFSINGNGGSDMLFVEGTQGADTIDVNDAASGANAVTVGGLLTVNYNAAMAQVEVDSLAGSDTINIAPSTTTSFLVDGGDPIGVVPGDTLNLIHPPGPFQIFAGPTSDSGGLKTAGFQTVSWVHIETLVNTGGGAPIITGTNGNDEITVIARDSSYNPANPGVPNPLLDGVQDFTVSVNGGPDMLFINTPDLFIDSLSGNDDIVVREPAPNQAVWNVQIFVAAGPPASGANRLGDNIELETPGTQSVTYTPDSPLSAVPPVAGVTFNAPNAGGGQFSDAGNSSTITATQFLIPGVYDSSPGGAENFIYAGEAGNDTLTYNTPANGNAGSDLVYTPGATADAGTITGSQSGGAALTPLTFSGLGTTGTVSFTTSNTGRTDHLNVEGVPTSAGESFSVTPANGGTVQLSQLPPASGIITLPLLTSSVSSLELDGLGGNDVFNLAGSLPYANTIVDDGAIVNLTGATGPVTVNLADTTTATNTTITGYGGTITLTGVDTANLDAGTNAVTVNGSPANDNLTVTPTGASSATAQDNGAGTVFNFTNAASFTTDLLGGNNTVVVNGTAGNDTIGVVRGAATTTVGVNALLPVNIASADATALTVASGLGTDTINVSGTGGPALTVLGGQTPASDTLNVTNTAAGTTTYTPGATNDSGTLANADGTISFGGMKLVSDLAATATDTLTVLGTNGNDTITAAHVGANNLAWVNGQAPIAFSGFGTLNLNGRFGNDSFVVSPVELTGLTAINVTGNAGASNTATINGSALTDAIAYSPTGAGAGTVAIGLATVNLTNMASLAINGQGGNDTLTVNGTAVGNDTFIHTPGAANDAGTVAVDTLLPVSYLNLGGTGAVNINETVIGTNNTLVVNGTAANDTFGVAGGTGTVTLNSRVPITETGIQNLQLNGLAGSDTFTLNATMPYTNAAVNGGNTANNDAVVLNGASGAIGVNLANQSASPPTLTTITGYGGTVSLSDIAQASINGSGADTLTLTGTPNDDQINYQPTSASGGNFSLTGLNTAFSFNIGSTTANTFTIFGGGNTGGDQVNVRGPNAGSTFIVQEQTGVVTVSNAAGTNLMPVTLAANVQTVELDAGVGNNTFLVDPAPGLLLAGTTDVVGQPNFVVPNNLLVNVVGGGAASQNALIVAAYNSTTGLSSTLDPSLFAVVNRTSNTDGVVRVFHSNGPAPANEPNQFPDISYSGVGIVSANTATNAATHQQQTLTMGPDLYEPNNSLNNAAYLGSGATINASNLTIFPNAFEHKFLQADQQWFRVVAQSTGTMDFQVYFNQYAGFLPGNGELQIQVYDAAGDEITDFGVNDQTSDQRRRIPVVAGETYYVQVYGVSQNPANFPQNPAAPDVFDPNNATINAYSLSIINTPAPTPDAVGLNNVVAQGTVNNSIAPTATTFAANNAPTPPPVIPPNFQTQPLPPLSSLDNFYVGMYLEFTSGALIGQRELVSGYVAATHTFTFAAAFAAAPAVGDTFQIESDDTGRSQLDNITRDNTPTIYIRLDAANTPGDGLIDLQGGGSTGQTPPNNVPIPIPFWAGNAATAPNSPANDGSYRIAVYDETDPQSPIFLGYANTVAGQTGVFQLQVTTPMSDGTHTLVAKVEMDSPGTPSNHDVGSGVSFSMVVDTQAPPVYFGSPTVANSGLQGASDTGVAGQPATQADRITADQTPTFYGVAEADAIIRLYVQTPTGNVLIGQTTATPTDGTNQDPSGAWTVTTTESLNNPSLGLPLDGVRNIFVTAEDVAGNVSAAKELTIFLDTQGPKVGNVSVTGNPGFNLFATKPNQPTPTPLINALDVTFTDQPVRVGPDFVYPAVNPILATTIANYQLVGKNNGPIPITSITFVDSTTSGTPGMSVATLHFAAPLPDDQYTLTISDKIEDNAGNPLDGEFNGTTFPSGNNSPGGSFGGTFVVNSHPHVAVYSNGSVSLDINGNGVFDPSNTVTDSDLVETFGFPSDRLFAGNFASPTGFVSGFDELGAYGFVNGQWRWLLNLTPSQGTSNPTTFIEPYSIDGLPVAGNFSGNPALGDQVGLFDGTTWWLDVLNHHTIDQADVAAGGKLTGDMKGIPIVGDFDGTGKVSLATYQDGVFEFDLISKEPSGKLTGNYNAVIDVQSLIPNNIGFSGVMARPVAADLDGDGITDIGLYVPGQTENAPTGVAEWFWLISNDSKDAGGVNPAGAFASLNHPFNPTPLGHDLFYRYGNQFALPLVGIWDPPVSAATTTNDPPSSGWIDNLYQNVLGRQPSATEESDWNNTISSGQMTDAQVAQTFIESSERLGSIINGYYEQYLGRSADQAGLNYWIGIWQAHGGPEQVQAGIIGSAEYFATAGKLYPSLSADAAWVTALYNNLLGRSPDAQGLTFWTNYIQTNSRQSVVLGFVTSAEYRLTLINGWFEEFLGRPTDTAGAQYWLSQMEQGMTQDEVQVALLTSDEFQNKQ